MLVPLTVDHQTVGTSEGFAMDRLVAAKCPTPGRTPSAHSRAFQSCVQLLILGLLLIGHSHTAALAAAQSGGPTSQAAPAFFNGETDPNISAALSEALKFNLFILGDLTQRRSVLYGRVAVGGNATLEYCRIGDAMPRSRENRADLVVGGTLVFTNGTVAKGGIVAASATLTHVGIPHGRLGEAPLVDFASHGPALTQLSTSLGQLPANGTTAIRERSNLKKQITLAGMEQRLNIFAISGQDLAATQTLIIKVPAGSSVLINITGPASRFQSLGFAIGNTNRQQILYNFYEATDLTLNDDRIQGSILAPQAKITLVAGRVNGTLIGAALTGSGVTWPDPFVGSLPEL
jgi:choice-of-anchor A domain-containing protein